jgi:hypothetical protein
MSDFRRRVFVELGAWALDDEPDPSPFDENRPAPLGGVEELGESLTGLGSGEPLHRT